jgi:cell division protein FtsB
MTEPVTVEQRHRDAATAFMSLDNSYGVTGLNYKVRLSEAFARFDHERNATLERENAALRKFVSSIAQGEGGLARRARNALGGQP